MVKFPHARSHVCEFFAPFSSAIHLCLQYKDPKRNKLKTLTPQNPIHNLTPQNRNECEMVLYDCQFDILAVQKWVYNMFVVSCAADTDYLKINSELRVVFSTASMIQLQVDYNVYPMR